MMLSRSYIFVAAVILLCQLSCTVDKIAGNGSQTGNPAITGMLVAADGKTPVCNASVYLRSRNSIPSGYFDIKQNPDTIAVVRTGCDGKFFVDSIDTGLYFIEGTDGGDNFTFIDSIFVQFPDSIIILPPAILKPAGAIKGTIVLSEGGDPQKVLVLVTELYRVTSADTIGTFNFEHLAEGHYTIKVIPTLDNYEVFDTTDIPVVSSDTTRLNRIDLLFTGIPAIRGLSVFYDTIQQRVSLYWRKPASALVKSYNIYRREIDPVSAFSKQINFSPVMDTFFIDSLCQQYASYQYHVTAVDSNTNEGARGTGVSTQIALFKITPQHVLLNYDTIKQTATLHWSNPDTSLVKSFNVYRRNVRLNEKFWTPFNNSPICDTFFIDSAFILCPTNDGFCDDLSDQINPHYEYCVAALIQNIREGIRSEVVPLQIRTNHLAPAHLSFQYDTLNQTVHLQWCRPAFSIVKGFSVFRRNSNNNETGFLKISSIGLSDTSYTDSTGIQNQYYEYRIASIIKNNRAEVKSTGVNVHIAASFVEDTVISNDESIQNKLSFPNDIAVSPDDDIYIVNQGTGSILVFDSAMNYKDQIGLGILEYPLKLSINEKGNIFTANYSLKRDISSVFIFDETGAVIDTILDSIVINDIDVKDSLLYVLSDNRSISVHSLNGIKKSSWQLSGQYSGQSIVSGDTNKIFVSTGFLLPEKNSVIVFDNLGNRKSSITVSDFPRSMAFNEDKQLLYVICYNGMHESTLHVIDNLNHEKARYKIISDDQNISIGIQKNGTVLLVFKGEEKIIKLIPQTDL